MKDKIFHIIGERAGTKRPPIPLRVILEHAQTAYSNHAQTLQQLDERGGLTPKEALHVLYDLRWNGGDESRRIQQLTFDEAEREMRSYVRRRYPQMIAAEQAANASPPCTHDMPERIPADADGVKRCPKCGCLIVL